MISLCSFIKNEESCVGQMIESVRDYVSEIVIVDTGSSDKSIEICQAYGARIYKAGLIDFGSMRTLACHLAREPWVLTLDADEILSDGYLLKNLTELGHDAYALPRKRWADLEMNEQIELEAWPDLQVRFFRNNINYKFKRELHEYFDGTAVRQVSHPIIQHFHDPRKTFEKKQERLELYTKLSKLAGVTIEGGKKL